MMRGLEQHDEPAGTRIISLLPGPPPRFLVAAAFRGPDQPAHEDSNPQEIAVEPFAGRKDCFAYNKKVAEKTVLTALHATRPRFSGLARTQFMGTPAQTMPPQAASAQVPAPSSAPAAQRTIHTAQLVAAMLKSSTHVSDLIFSPGRAPQIEVSGQLTELKFKGLECLSSQDTLSIANDIMGKNETPIRKLEPDASADLSYGIPGVARFRVNIFKQPGSCSILIREVPHNIPRFEELSP